MAVFQLLFTSLLACLGFVAACQEHWLMDRENKFGEVIGFRNTTRLGKHESLLWQWNEMRGGRWSSRVWLSLEEDKAYGGFRYSHMGRRTGKSIASLTWKLDKSSLTWLSSGDAIHSTVRPWKISLCRRKIQWQFTPEVNGSWEFKIGNVTIESGKDGSLQSNFSTWADDEPEVQDNRTKRSTAAMDYPYFVEESTSGKLTLPIGNGTRLAIKSVLEAIIQFFFGGADSRNDEGFIGRIARLIQQIACRMRGGCTNIPGGQPSNRTSDPPVDSQAEMLPNRDNRL